MNNFTAETRRQLKREQKTRVMENLGRCIGIQLMYLVPYVLLMVILYVSVFGRAFALIAGGVSANDYQLMAALSRGLNTIWLCIALMLAITGPLQFGLMHFYIGLAHGEDVTVGTLMYPFTSLKSVWGGHPHGVYAVAAQHYLVNRADCHLFGNRIFGCCGCLGYGTVSGNWRSAAGCVPAGDDSDSR